MVSSLCNQYLQNFSFLSFQTLHNDCSHIEDMHLPFCAYLIIIFLFLTGVEVRHFPSKLRGVSDLCYRFSFFYIQTLHNECSNIDDVYLLSCTNLMTFFHFWGLELRFFFCKMLGGCLV